ncbi:MAG: DUF2079 domain-containing protein [Deltaproteobacteria bacterium]|nr:DUF2079 domain-containing protein [Deltaproteobacteria bacterium]MCB9786605.1 DUF2079 domain-containing protein [Deltaproteobacteria bacterium]
MLRSPPTSAQPSGSRARTLLSLGLAALLTALSASGLAVFLGALAMPDRRIDAYARDLERDPFLAVGIYGRFAPALVLLLLTTWALAALRPRRLAFAPPQPLADRLRAVAWQLSPLALLPTTLWFDHVPGRAILAAALVGLAAALALGPFLTGQPDPAPGPAPPARTPRLVAAALAVASGAFLFAVSYQRHRAHWSSLIDLGLFYELYDNPQGRLLYSPTLGMSFLGEHFSPTLALLWPLVALVRTPVTLLAIQAATIAAGAWLIYDLAALRTRSHLLGLAMLLAYALCPYIQQAAFYDFHLDMLEPPLLIGFVLAIHRRRTGWMWLTALLLWGTKEDTFIYTSVIAVVLLIAEGRRREGYAILFAGLAIGALVLGAVLPALRAPYDPSHFATVGHTDGYAFGSRYAGLGPNPAAALRLLLLNPFGWVSDIVGGAGLTSVLALLLVMGPTTLAARWRFLLLVPAMEMLLGDRMRVFPFYYGAVVIPFAALVAIEGARELAQRRARQDTPPRPTGLLDLIARRTSGAQLAAGLLAGSLALWLWHPSSALASHGRHDFIRTPHQEQAEALLDALPPGAPVSATGYLAVHLQSRHPTAMIPYDLDTAERVVVDLQRPPWPVDYAQLQARLERLVQSGEFTVESADRESGLLVLARAPKPGPADARDRARELRQLLATPVMEAELTEDTAFPDRRVRDPEARNGAMLSVGTADARGPDHLFYGPYLTLPPGRYRATFRLRWQADTTLTPPPGRKLVTLDVVPRGGAPLATRDLTAADLTPVAGRFIEPSLDFELEATRRDVELRVFYHDFGRLDLDQVRLDAR